MKGKRPDMRVGALRRLHRGRMVAASGAFLMIVIVSAFVAASAAAAAPGYWLGADDGGVFSFNAPYHLSIVQGIGMFGYPGDSVCAQGCTIASLAGSGGYWQLTTPSLNPSNFSDEVPEGPTVSDYPTTVRGDDLSSISTPISRIRPWRIAAVGSGSGVWIANANGTVYSAAGAPNYGSLAGQPFEGSIVGIASTPDGGGFWLVSSRGGVFTFGDAAFYGSMGASHLNAPVVGMAPTNDGHGYWLVGSDGGVFAFGDAAFAGSMGATRLDAPMVAIAANPDGSGYWSAAADGGVFAFGDAPFLGSMVGTKLNAPVTGMATNH
jgi:hypothetical protein